MERLRLKGNVMNLEKRKEAARSGNVLDASPLTAEAAEMPGKPYQSVLNPHLEEIKYLRRQRRTWDEIASKLSEKYGISASGPSVYKFAKRVENRRGKTPFGFEPLDGEKSPSHPAASPAGDAPVPSPLAPPQNFATPEIDAEEARENAKWEALAALKNGLPPS